MAESSAGWTKSKGLFFAAAVCWFVLLVAWVNLQLAHWQARTDPRFPAGVITLPNGQTYTQDFACQMIFFRGLREHAMTRPYTMVDQETFFRHALPMSQSGMTHAYSPVAYALIRPLLSFSGPTPYLIYTILCALGFLLLLYFWLLSRATAPPQLTALAVCIFSLCLVFGFEVGQSAILTTALLGAFWAVLARRNESSWNTDILPALLFWALCLKPSVAIVPAMMLLAARAWRPMLLGALLLLVTWTALCGHYGGWWIGLRDYATLLNHYNNAGMSAFLRRGAQTAASFHRTEILFSLNRTLLLGLSAVLVLLRWLKRISASGHFLAMGWVFLIFSPYLLPSELWLIVLLVVEGPFFRAQRWGTAVVKLLLLAAVLDLRDGMALPVDVNYPLKCALAAWMLLEALRQRSRPTVSTNSSAPNSRSSSGHRRGIQKSC